MTVKTLAEMTGSSVWQYALHFVASERDLHSVSEALNAHGRDGWEVVAVYPKDAGTVFVMKKKG